MSENLSSTPILVSASSSITNAIDLKKHQQDRGCEMIQTLTDALRYLLSQQGYPIDNIRLHDMVERHSDMSAKPSKNVHQLGRVIAVLNGIGIDDIPKILAQPDAAFLPLLAYY